MADRDLPTALTLPEAEIPKTKEKRAKLALFSPRG